MHDAEPFTNEGLGVFFGSSNGRRLAVAFAIAIALHEVAAGLVPAVRAPHPQREVVITAVRTLQISARPHPAAVTDATLPQPSPSVVRTPTHAKVIAVVRRAGAAPRAAHPTAGQGARAPWAARPVWGDISRLAGSRASSGAGASSGAVGTGSGSEGTGSDVASAQEPCGFVTFSDPHGSRFDPRSRGFWVEIRMSVHFADGSSQTVMLDYPWYYPSEAANPWSDQNLRDPNFPTRFQPPPAEKSAEEPALVQYVVEHSTPDGMTLLRACPQPAPALRL